MITYDGDYRVNWSKRGLQSDTYFCSARISTDGTSQIVNDLCPIRKVGEEWQFYLNIIPFGPNHSDLDEVLQDCDLLMYIDNPVSDPRIHGRTGLGADGLDPMRVVALMKQRGYHAEAGYHGSDGRARQVALWGHENAQQCDRIFHEGHTQNNVIHIFRLKLGLAPEKECQLKRELHNWKRIFNRHDFPDGMSMNLDPVDFRSIDELGEIARKLLSRPADSATGLPPVNCVQWTNQAIALALNFPLTERTIDDLGIKTDFENRWVSQGLLGYSDASAEPLGRLPLPLYSPAMALQAALDMYFGGIDLLEFLETAGANTTAAIFSAVPTAPIPSDLIRDYIKRLSAENSLDVPLRLPDGSEYMTVYPSMFLLESRRHARNPDLPGPNVEYIATAVHEDYVTHV